MNAQPPSRNPIRRLLQAFSRPVEDAPVPAVAAPAGAAMAVAPALLGDSTVNWFRVATHDGKPLTLRGMPARLGYVDAFDAAYSILAAVPAAMGNVCVLLAPDGSAFSIEADTAPGIAASALILPTDTPGVVRLKYPISGPAFLIAMGDGSAEVRFDGAGDTINVAFALVAIAQSEIPAAASALGAEIGAASGEGLRAAPLLARLERGALRPELAEALIRVMPRDELEAFARLLLERPAMVALLGRAMPQNPWVRQHLSMLVRWQRERNPGLAEAYRQSPASDALFLYPVKRAGLVSAGLALNSLARRIVLPRRNACVLATARNEGAYLLDWIAYHLSIGFEHIFLYTNDNQDGSDELLEALDSAGVISWIRNERGEKLGAQEKAYAHALTMVPQILDYRWTAVIDLDEYIGFDTNIFGGIGDFIRLQEAQSVDAIALCWQLFGALPGETWREEFTPARLRLRMPDADKHVKTIMRPRLFWWSRPHDPVEVLDGHFDYRTQDGLVHHRPGVGARPAAFAESPSANQAWVNHYFVRTAEEGLWKWARGRANWLDEKDRGIFMDMIAQNFIQLGQPERMVRDDRLVDCAAGMAKTRDRLLAIRGVEAANAAIQAFFARELKRLKAEFLAAPPRAGEHDAVRQLRTILAETP